MSPKRFLSRAVVFCAVLGCSAAGHWSGVFEERALIVEVGEAGLAVNNETARVVEQVAYRYDVTRVGDVLVTNGAPSGPLTNPDVAAMWQLVDHVWPDRLQGELRQLSVIEDAPRGLVGVVHPSADGGWILSLDSADLGDRALMEETIVHELSHVVTLSDDHFTFGGAPCFGVLIDLGCAADETVLAEFARTFWSDDTNESEFVNDYAATAAHEDLAETFTAWVLGWPVESPAVEAKIALIAADPELATLAAELRDVVSEG